jgi:5-methylcytosine-specific restriction protein A
MPFKPEAHNRKALDDRRGVGDRKRGTPGERGYDQGWRVYSKARLREHPFCVLCKAEGKLVRARVTDHIKPAYAFPELFLSENNHQSLCVKCNLNKSLSDKQLYASALSAI